MGKVLISNQYLDDIADAIREKNGTDNAYMPRQMAGAISGIHPEFELIYPVGSIYMSVNSVNPSTLFGGTWEQITGKFLLACDTTYEAGTTGGASTVSLSTENLPSHTHSVGAHAHGLNNHTHTGPSHTHTGPSHTHGLNGHTHTGPSHTHGLNGHTHTGPSHTHAMQSHTHGLSSHYHYVPAQNGSTDGRLSTSCIYLMRCTGNARAFATSAGDAGNITYSEQNGWPDDNYGLWQSFQRTGGEKYRPDRIIFYLNHAHSVSTNAVNSNGPSNNTSGGPSNNTTTASGTGNTGGNSGNTTAAGTGATGGNSGNTTAAGTGATGAAGTGATGGPSVANTANSTAFNSGSTGSGTAHNNMPPYLAVYIWKRVA